MFLEHVHTSFIKSCVWHSESTGSTFVYNVNTFTNVNTFSHKFENYFTNCELQIKNWVKIAFFFYCMHYKNISTQSMPLLRFTWTEVLRCKYSEFNKKQNKFILNTVIKYTLEPNWFNGPFWQVFLI